MKKALVRTLLVVALYVPVVTSGDVVVQPVRVDKQWSYLDAGEHYIAPGTVVVTRDGGYQTPDRMLHYPAGYYRDGKASAEMMSSWLPSDAEHIYVQSKGDVLRIMRLVQSSEVRAHSAMKKWIIGAGLLCIGSLVHFLRISRKFDRNILHDNETPTGIDLVTYIASFPIGFLSGAKFVEWICKELAWSKAEFLTAAVRERLLTAVRAVKPSEAADDCEEIVVARVVNPGAREGLIPLSACDGELAAGRRVEIYKVDTVPVEKRK